MWDHFERAASIMPENENIKAVQDLSGELVAGTPPSSAGVRRILSDMMKHLPRAALRPLVGVMKVGEACSRT